MGRMNSNKNKLNSEIILIFNPNLNAHSVSYFIIQNFFWMFIAIYDFFLPTFIFPIKQGQTQDFKLARAGIYRKKKIKIGIHIVLKNYKYSKLLFLNTLRCIIYQQRQTKTK